MTASKVRALRVETTLSDGWLETIAVEGELDAYTAPRLMEAVTLALEQGIAWLLIDLRAVDYIDSVGLGILIGGAKRAGERSGDMAVACSRPGVRRVFEVSGTAELLNVVDDLPAAVAILTAAHGSKPGTPSGTAGGDGR